MECDPTRVCELLVGLGDVEVLGVDDEGDGWLRVHVRRRARRPGCGSCGGPLCCDGERAVDLVDLPAFGRTVRLRPQAPLALLWGGAVGGQAAEIALRRGRLTARAARWATRQAGLVRSLKEAALELGCVWLTTRPDIYEGPVYWFPTVRWSGCRAGEVDSVSAVREES